MRMMNWIESTAINADLFQRPTLNAQPGFGKSMARRRSQSEPLNIEPCALICAAHEERFRGSTHYDRRSGQGGVPGKELDAETAQLFRRVQPGAFILFGRNLENAAQLRKLIDDLRDVSEIEPIITVDQEGGRVSRLRRIGSEPPNAQQLRETDDVNLIRRHGDITGRLLRLFGFNLDLCPVLDISFDDEAENSLRGRCYGRTVQEVIRNAGAFNEAMREQGIASCGKHFPGYSAATSDAHYQLPRIDRTREELDQNELAVFRQFANNVDSIMICHGWYPCFETEKTPASLSRRVITDLLRGEFGFNGLAMTDDLDMGAILTGYTLEDTIRLAVMAGNDLVMICHRIPEIENVRRILGTLPADQVDRALASIARFKKNLTPPDEFSERAFQKTDREVWDLRVDVLGEERAKVRDAQSRPVSPVEMF